MCLLSPRSVLGAEESVLLVSHGPTLAPGRPTAVIADKIKHIQFQKESKYPLLPTISIMPLCSQSLEPIQPLATRAEAWQAIPGVSEWVRAMILTDAVWVEYRKGTYSVTIVTSVPWDMGTSTAFLAVLWAAHLSRFTRRNLRCGGEAAAYIARCPAHSGGLWRAT